MNNLSKFGNLAPEKINLINIIPLGRVSSVFLQGFLDGHPKIINLLCFEFQNIRKFTNKSLDSLIEEIYLTMALAVKDNGYDLSKEFPKKVFTTYTKEYVENFGFNRKSLFIGIYYAYAKYTKMDLNKIKYILVLNHVHIESLDSLKIFPKQKMIFAVRDPRSNFLSLKKGLGLFGIFSQQKNGFTLFKKMLKNKPLNVLAIRHEDLHTKFDYVKKRLSNFLEIPDSKTLNSSTFLRKPFYGLGNMSASSTKLRSNLPNKKFVSDSWRYELSTSEIKNIQFFSSRFMKTFGYKKIYNFEPLQINLFDTRFIGLSKEFVKTRKGVSKIILLSLRSIYNLPIIGGLTCKAFVGFLLTYNFFKGYFKIKYTKIF